MNTPRPHRERFATCLSQAPAKNLLDDESGDVPGWVLVTLMTAGLSVIRVSG